MLHTTATVSLAFQSLSDSSKLASAFPGVIVACMSDYRHKRHNVSSLLYHIVCPAKYRRVLFDTEVAIVLKDVCLDIAKRYEIVF